MEKTISKITEALEQHLVRNDFQGWDPFDAFNSPLVKSLSKWHRLTGVASLQVLKRLPVNLRPMLGVRKGINPKGWGLLVAAYVTKYKWQRRPEDLAQACRFADWLLQNPSPNCSGAAWGYNFDWYNRNAIFPAGTPTIVNTAYIAEALLDLFEVSGDKKYKDAAVSSADFLLKDLNRSGTDEEFCFSYTPLDKTQIHNANMMGAALLARIYCLMSKESGSGIPAADSPGLEAIKSAAQASMRFSINRQQPDGSWLYGTEERNSWIDSYHTGYNLLALKRYLSVFPEDDRAEQAMLLGYRFYLDHFFTPEGFVKYYHNATYPWDAHAMAHAVLTLDGLECIHPEESRVLREKVLARIQDTFWDERRGCFIYLVGRHGKNRIDYIRWVQMWMFYALVSHLTKDSQ